MYGLDQVPIAREEAFIESMYPRGDHPPPGPAVGHSTEGRLTIELDGDIYCVDLPPGHTSRDVEAALAEAREAGYEPIDPEECEAEYLPGGIMRIWLVPVDPVDEVQP